MRQITVELVGEAWQVREQGALVRAFGRQGDARSFVEDLAGSFGEELEIHVCAGGGVPAFTYRAMPRRLR